MWKGQLTFETPMLFSVGFSWSPSLLGGLTGVLAGPPLDFHVTDGAISRVAHLSLRAVSATIVFATFAGIYFWFPKMIGPAARRAVGQTALLVDVHRFSPPRSWCSTGWRRGYRVAADYPPADGFQGSTVVSTIGPSSWVHRCLCSWNVSRAGAYGRGGHRRDPWGYGNLLEGDKLSAAAHITSPSCSCIRSEPAFGRHYPHMVERLRAEAHVGVITRARHSELMGPGTG